MRIVIAAAAVSLLLCTACNKDDTNNTTSHTVTIVFDEPEEGEVLNPGDSLHMEVNFENDGGKVENAGIWLVNDISGDTLYSLVESPHIDDYYFIHEHYPVSIADTFPLTVTAASWDDGTADSVFASVHVNVNP